MPSDRDQGVLCDQYIAANGHYASRDYAEPLRRVRFRNPETGKTLVFLTNNMTLPALMICALYKKRWMVELFFKWTKQHLRIKRFLGTRKNDIKSQVWCAVATYALIAIAKKELQIFANTPKILLVRKPSFDVALLVSW